MTTLNSASKIVVFGAGFIGYHVIQELRSRDYWNITIFDRHERNKPHIHGVDFYLGDIRDKETVTEVIKDADGVINLAGILGTQETIDDPHSSVDTNIHGALNIFDACRMNSMLHMPKAVHIIVGNHWMNNTYSITKTCSERFARMYNREHGTKIAVVRGLNVYGPWQKHMPVRKIIPSFIVQALRKEPIQIYGDGSQIMDMIYASDAAGILVEALEWEHESYDTVFEAGTGRRTTVLEIAQLVNKLTHNEAGVTHLPMRPGEEENSIVLADTTTLASMEYANTSNFVSLEEGITKTIKWHLEHRTYV
jgi:nucleoside-diphosphate-sugar epimerase